MDGLNGLTKWVLNINRRDERMQNIRRSAEVTSYTVYSFKTKRIVRGLSPETSAPDDDQDDDDNDDQDD